MSELEDKNKLEKYFHKENGPVFSYTQSKKIDWNKDNNKKKYFLVKDNFWTKENETTSSSLFLKGFFPLENSTVVNLLTNSGYELLGKSHLDEFACGGLGMFSCEGIITNPHDKERVVGGSSSGSAFSVSENIVEFSIGHDAGDSVRRPSSYCGIIGFKPSYGSISRYGIIPMASSFDTVGIMSKKIEIIEEIFKKISKVDYKDITTLALRKLGKPITPVKSGHKKIVVIKGLEKLISKEYFEIYKEKIEEIKKNNNFSISEIIIPTKIRESLQISYLILCSSEITSHLSSLKGITYGCKNFREKTIREKRSSMIGKWAKERIIIGSYFLKEKHLVEKANVFRIFLVEWIKKLFRNYDFLIFPGTEDIAPKIKELSEEKNIKESKWIDNLMLLSNLAGNPSINIPLGKVKNMPVSINIDSSWNNEEDLINFSKVMIKSNKTSKNTNKD